MDLQTHKAVILDWIVSCATDEQLDLLEDVVLTFIVDRFKGKVSQLDIDFAKGDLADAIDVQRKVVTTNTFSLTIYAEEGKEV